MKNFSVSCVLMLGSLSYGESVIYLVSVVIAINRESISCAMNWFSIWFELSVELIYVKCSSKL